MFHLPQSWLRRGGEIAPFYQKAFVGFDELQIPCKVEALNRDRLMDRIDADDWFHIVNHGRIEHPRALMAGVAYIYPFWHLDPKGIRAFSSIADKRFRPGRIDGDKARDFFHGLQRKWVKQRRSRYEQQMQVATDLPTDFIAVFLQSEAHRDLGETCYLDSWQMIETCLAATGKMVVVKPHPKETDQNTFERLLAMAARHDRLQISTANIHDILACAQRVVTINSAVGIEAYLHRKPVILCGQADFHHVADVATSCDELARHLQTEPSGRVYAKYLYWYFARNCLNAAKGNVARQIVRKINATGYQLD